MKGLFRIPADFDTPVSAFLKLAELSPRYLLESVVGGERVGRYSFIGFGKPFEVRLQGGQLMIGGSALPAPRSKTEFLARIREAVAAAPKPGPVPHGFPFQGGLVGATAYDIVRYIERVELNAPAVDHPDIAWVATQSVLVFDHATRRAGVLHDGPEHERAALESTIRALFRGPIVVPEVASPFVEEHPPSLTEAEYVAAVHRAQEHIAAGDVFQLVLSVAFGGRTNVAPFQVYRALRLLNPSPYMYFVDLGDLKLVGSSPEALVKVEGRRAVLRPIAGTRPRGATVEQDLALERELLADPKEAAEHVMLVDLARNDVGRVAVPGTVRVDPYRIIERYSHVMHIVSGVSGALRPDMDPVDLFAATFPAGTVVGAPKVRAMELIDELEPVRRGLYAGTVGYFGHGGSMDQAIAIRTMVFQGDTYRLQVGAGVVADSQPELEYAEVCHKGAALLAALRLAKEGL